MNRILQINLNRSSTAQNLLQQTAAATGAKVLLISDQNWNPTQDVGWTASADGTCAVSLTPAADFVADTSGSGRGFAWIQTCLRIYSCYNSRNDSDANLAAFLADLDQSVRSADPHCSIIIGGDFNAWSQEWGSARNDARGEQLADLAASLSMIVGNVGTTPTYRRINAESVIDVTFSRLEAPATISGWRVLEDLESASDHRYIEYTLYRTLDDEEIGVHPPSGWSF